MKRRSNPIGIIFILLVFTVSVNGQEKFNKVKIGETISISLPESFYPMSDDDIASKFLTPKKPMAVYTNSQRVIEFSINESNTVWGADDLELMKDFYKASINSLYDQIVIVKEEIVTINKRSFIVFEFNSTVKGESESIINKGDINKYNFIQYTIVNGKTILLNFSCSFRDRNYWKPVIEETMNSIKIAGK